MLGRSRLGMEPFHVEAVVDATYKRLGRRFGRQLPAVVCSHDDKRMTDVRAATRAAKLGRDKVIIRTGLYRPITVNDAILADGRYRLGQILRTI